MRRYLVCACLAALAGACAAPIQRVPPVTAPSSGPTVRSVSGLDTGGRPAVGVAFGGGSARGIAHVGVIRWFEEHRIPIDVAAGTSMGGLIGGAFATGMDAAELDLMLQGLNWDELFGSSSFGFKNIRRKADARAYPARLEFGIKNGLVPPASLNNGEQVDLLIGRITASYYEIKTFDELPTPFRTVAVDLLSARDVVMDSGPLAFALRATMSLPLIFPPVESEGRVLVDGGAMNNVPADVVRGMGASRVVAVNVGDLADRDGVSFTMLGLAGATLDAMMRASTLKAISAADIVINVPLKEYGSLDWRRSEDLQAEGYKAAEAMRDQLLPLVVSEPEYEKWKEGRRARRRSQLPTPAFISTEGFGSRDELRLRQLLEPYVGQPFNIETFQSQLATLSALDRYETVTWRFVRNEGNDTGLLVRARPKPYAPPFMMLGLNLENTTSEDFKITVTSRYLGFDHVGSGSELRVDGTLGSDPALAGELYRPFGASPLFASAYAGVANQSFSLIDDDGNAIAKYGQTGYRIGLDAGINLGRLSDLRIGAYVGHLDSKVKIGLPLLPSIEGKQTLGRLAWRLDTQDSPVIPSGGVLGRANLQFTFDGPNIKSEDPGFEISSKDLWQLDLEGNRFWTLRERNRVFVLGQVATSFDGNPIPIEQFSLGLPLHLGAYSVGELRGNHAYVLTGGLLRQLGRLPDFMGGAVFAGAWLENGDAFDEWDLATLRTNASLGVIMDTLIGPVLLAGSAGFDGRWRTYIGVGRLFK